VSFCVIVLELIDDLMEKMVNKIVGVESHFVVENASHFLDTKNYFHNIEYYYTIHH